MLTLPPGQIAPAYVSKLTNHRLNVEHLLLGQRKLSGHPRAVTAFPGRGSSGDAVPAAEPVQGDNFAESVDALLCYSRGELAHLPLPLLLAPRRWKWRRHGGGRRRDTPRVGRCGAHLLRCQGPHSKGSAHHTASPSLEAEQHPGCRCCLTRGEVQGPVRFLLCGHDHLSCALRVKGCVVRQVTVARTQWGGHPPPRLVCFLSLLPDTFPRITQRQLLGLQDKWSQAAGALASV
mmetsp:Transcript_25089/g.73288  ORF Transcript_25089/g.73288 Transcript_25089/m.73288 type:complete len:234 (-) Transcript_25089:193-894(-)